MHYNDEHQTNLGSYIMADSVTIQEKIYTNNKIFYDVYIKDFGRIKTHTAYSNKEEFHTVLRWDSNDNTVPMDLCQLGKWTYIEQQRETMEIETRRFMRKYQEAQRNRTAEEIAQQHDEARAAMGQGVEMVDVITGERYTT